MRAILVTVLVAPLIVLAAPTAEAASCVTHAEHNIVDMGDTRSYVEGSIFDGYGGVVVDSWANDDYSFRLKAYAACNGEDTGTIVYRKADGGSWRVYNKAWA